MISRFLFFLVVLLASPSLAAAQLTIDISKGNSQAVQIAIPDFISRHSETDKIGQSLAGVVRADLERSGLFKALDPAGLVGKITDANHTPNFTDWKVSKAKILVAGQMVRVNANQHQVEFRIWDVYSGTQLEGMRFSSTPENWRRIAHKVSDTIYKRLTGEDGYFDSRIVFIDESGPKTNRQKRLAIMDQDGAKPQYLLAGADLVLTPRFSPTSQTITYLSWESGRAEVYLLDIATNRRERLGDFSGMTIAPRFSPDGKHLIFSMVERGNTDIYTMNLATRTTRRLTTNRAIDVSPSFSPDGKKIVFNSDRGGSPQLYTMNADGSNVRRLSFGQGRYTSPAWSPRGDMIAFTRAHDGKFHIGVMDADSGRAERSLTSSYLDEGPTWSPNGRVLLFTREGKGRDGAASIWSIDLTGRNLRRLNTPGGASDPAWSPLLD